MEQELMQTHANYVKGKIFTLHRYRFFVYAVASPSGEEKHISVEKMRNLMQSVAFAPSVIMHLKAGVSHSTEHLFLRQILKKRQMMKYLKNRYVVITITK